MKSFEKFCEFKLESLDHAPPDQIINLKNLDQFLDCETKPLLENFNSSQQFKALKLLSKITEKITKLFNHPLVSDQYRLHGWPLCSFSLEVGENNQTLVEIKIENKHMKVNSHSFLQEIKEIKEYFPENELFINYNSYQFEKPPREFLTLFGTSVIELHLTTPNQELLNVFLENCPRLMNLIIQGLANVKNLENLPDSITYLSITNCEELETINFFSPSLKTLEISGNENLKKFPAFPATLENLKVDDLKEIEEFPAYPEKLKKLYVGIDLPFDKVPKTTKNLELFTYNTYYLFDNAYQNYLLDACISLGPRFILELANNVYSSFQNKFQKNKIEHYEYEIFINL